MNVKDIAESIADYLVENTEYITLLFKEKERDEIADLIYAEITEE